MRRLLWSAMFALAMVGRADAAANDYFTEFVKDFGVTSRGPVLTHYFAITNTTKATLTIGTARVSCGCVSASVLKNQLAPGESTSVVAMMDTRRIPQANTLKTVTVYVPFLSPILEEVSLRVMSIARDDLVMSPDTIALGTVRKGKGGTASMKVTLYNFGSWDISEATSTGKFVKAEFKLANRGTSEVTFDVTATLDPTCPVGNWTSDIFIKTNAPGIEKLRIPVTLNVVVPISTNPEDVKLTDLKPGITTEHRVLLQGTQPFKIMEVKGNDDEVTVKAQSEESRPVHILTVAVTPKAMGTMVRSFEIITDHKEMTKIVLPFKATVK